MENQYLNVGAGSYKETAFDAGEQENGKESWSRNGLQE